MTTQVNFQQEDERRDAIHRAVHLLVDGHCVGLPTETGYTIAALSTCSAAVQLMLDFALTTLDGKPEQLSTRWQLLLQSAGQAEDYFPSVSRTTRRLMQRGWPGALVIEQSSMLSDCLLGRLPVEFWGGARYAASGVTTRLRVCDHPAIVEILDFLPAPLLVMDESAFVNGNGASAKSGDQPSGKPVLTPDDLAKRSNVPLELLVDDGRCEAEARSSVVRVHNDLWRVTEPGAISIAELQRMAGQVFLFVCTGNTCRSPMAEALFRKYAAERVGCAESELSANGVIVESAGLAAGRGMPASPDSVRALRRVGVELNSHSSQPVTIEMLERCDYVFTMTQGHRESIVEARPDLANRVQLLSDADDDISDPIGGTEADYIACCNDIEHHIRRIVELVELPR